MPERTIGIMSGTSLDGIDAILVEWSGPRPLVQGFRSLPMPAELRAGLLTLNQRGDDELHRAALAANQLALLSAGLVQALLADAGLSPIDVRAVGVHGQTVRHQPGAFDGIGYTWQINQPALLAERCGIDVVADFRSRDVAAGGQGAPLVPPFHQALFARTDRTVAVVNIGGIANLTVLAPGLPVRGFDCGPGNCLLDFWCQQHIQTPYDQDGAWARTGQIRPELLASLLGHAFFAAPPPKSTGRDDFHPRWLAQCLAQCAPLASADVQATLAECTARTIADALAPWRESCQALYVCGGGALNGYLMERLQSLCPGVTVSSTATHGVPPLQVEAMAFAWLALQTLHRSPASLPSVTGARGPRILGAIYPAG